MIKQLTYGLLLLSLIYLNPTQALHYPHNGSDAPLQWQLALLADKTGQLTIESIRHSLSNQAFQAVNADSPIHLGYSQTTWWLRFSVHSHTAYTGYLMLKRTLSCSIDTFAPTDKVHIEPIHNSNFPTYQIDLTANTQTVFYLRLSNCREPLTLPINLLNADQAVRSHNNHLITATIIITGMLVLALYDLLLSISLREPKHLAIVAFILSLVLLFNRDSHLLPFPSLFNQAHSPLYLAPMLLTISSAFWHWRTLGLRCSRWVAHTTFWMQRLPLALLPFSALLFSVERWLTALLAIILLILLAIFTRRKLKDKRISNGAYWATSTIMVALTLYAAMRGNWLPYSNNFIQLTQFGTLFGLILISFVRGEQTRDLREQKKRMIASNRSKSELLTAMSHELRNPMHAIISASDLLQHTQLSTIQQSYLKQLNASSQHILGLVDGVLDLSRLEAGRLELQQHTFKPQDKLNTIREMFTLTAQRKGLTFTVQHDAPPAVIGDPTRLSQVLINLISNAIKFTPEGSINVNLRSYASSCKQNAQNGGYLDLYFEVLDSGIGIPPQVQEQMFSPFEQGDAAITRHYGGSGVGLAISHKLVALMGAQLKVDSQVNAGSRFYFKLTLPIAHNEEPSTSTAPITQQTFNSHILLVDDDEVNRFMGKLMLEQLGTQVELAHNGQQALDKLQQQSFDLVMLDLSMPDMDGYTSARKIRAMGHKHLIILAVTASSHEGIEQRCQEAGINNYLNKPFGIDRLRHVLEEYCS